MCLDNVFSQLNISIEYGKGIVQVVCLFGYHRGYTKL
jgi:hypothetical protein